MAGWQACCVTLIFRALQRLQPVLDFLWERRGGILGLGLFSGAVGGLAKSVVGGCYRDGVGIARLPGRGGGGAGRRREGVDGLRRWRWTSRCVVQYVRVSRWGIRKRKGGRCWVWGSSMLLWKTVFGSAEYGGRRSALTTSRQGLAKLSRGWLAHSRRSRTPIGPGR